jgi:hypothetical protein
MKININGHMVPSVKKDGAVLLPTVDTIKALGLQGKNTSIEQASTEDESGNKWVKLADVLAIVIKSPRPEMANFANELIELLATEYYRSATPPLKPLATKTRPLNLTRSQMRQDIILSQIGFDRTKWLTVAEMADLIPTIKIGTKVTRKRFQESASKWLHCTFRHYVGQAAPKAGKHHIFPAEMFELAQSMSRKPQRTWKYMANEPGRVRLPSTLRLPNL